MSERRAARDADEALLGPVSRFFISQRLRLHYVDWGNHGAPTLVLVHGGRDHARSWDWVARELRRDWHVVAPDLRGHGDSAWAVGSLYHMVEYVIDLAQLLQAIGGYAAQAPAVAFPETVELGRVQAEDLSLALLGERRVAVALLELDQLGTRDIREDVLQRGQPHVRAHDPEHSEDLVSKVRVGPLGRPTAAIARPAETSLRRALAS